MGVSGHVTTAVAQNDERWTISPIFVTSESIQSAWWKQRP